MMKFVSRLLTLLIVLSISRVDVVVADVLAPNTPKVHHNGKTLHSGDKVISGQIYRIKSSSIVANEELTVQVTANGYSKTYKTESTFDGYVKVAIPFIIDKSTLTNPKLKKLNNVSFKIVEKGIFIKKVDIKKPILLDLGRGAVLKKFLKYIQSENEDVIIKAQAEGRAEIVTNALPFRTVLNDILNQFQTTGTITGTAGTETASLNNNGIDLLDVMIAASVHGIINEDSDDSLKNNDDNDGPLITLNSIKPFFNNPDNYDPESIVLGVRELNLLTPQKNAALNILVGFFAVMVALKLKQLFFKYGIDKKIEKMWKDVFIGAPEPTILACNNPSIACINCKAASQALFNSIEDVLHPPAGSAPVACLTISNTTGASPLLVLINSSCTSDPDDNIHRMSIAIDGIPSEQCGRINDGRYYTTSGSHTVTITVFDTDGASSTRTYNYNVVITGSGDKDEKINSQEYLNRLVMKPFYDAIKEVKTATADFSYSPTSGDTYANVNFDASSSSGPYILQYYWTFSDGSSPESRCWPKFQRSFNHTTGVTLSVLNNIGETATSTEKTVSISNGD